MNFEEYEMPQMCIKEYGYLLEESTECAFKKEGKKCPVKLIVERSKWGPLELTSGRKIENPESCFKERR